MFLQKNYEISHFYILKSSNVLTALMCHFTTRWERSTANCNRRTFNDIKKNKDQTENNWIVAKLFICNKVTNTMHYRIKALLIITLC